jgi:hypothetical protein
MSGNVNRGVVIIAAGIHVYGQWAVNLAMGLKQTDSDTKITLLWKGKGLDLIHQYISIFENVIEIPDSVLERNGLESLLRTKVCLYDLSPYDETIYIDADVIWFPNKPISMLFDEMKNVDVTIGSRGKSDLSTDPRLIWSNPQEMLQKFGDVTIWNLSSEFMYFKKNDKVKEFFDIAQEAFDNPGVEYTRFAGTVPDELAFQIAMIKTGIKPHVDKFLPFYWEPYEKRNKSINDLYKENWYGYSIGGAQLTVQQKAIYDALVKNYAKGFGIKYPGMARSKREFLPNRREI